MMKFEINYPYVKKKLEISHFSQNETPEYDI